MYNEQLEQLIDAALADGELTEKEKQILFKKAQSFGIDLDEFEMVLDSRLVKLKKSESSAPKSNKLGDVKKCPVCGAIIQSYHGICPDCGYAFEGLEANSSVQKLSAELEEKGVYKDDDEGEDYEKMAAIIKRFPIPTTKSDLIELVSYLQTLFDSMDIESRNDIFAKSCVAKLHECSRKAKLMFPNDILLTTTIKDLDNFLEKKDKQLSHINTKNAIFGALLVIAGIVVGYGIWQLEWKAIWRVITIAYTAFPLIMGGVLKICDKKK